MTKKPDFGGYATKYGLLCSDGRTIQAPAFKHADKTRRPLVWKHDDSSATNILGHTVLEHRDDGVYSYGFFNDTPAGQHAKAMVQNGDINSLSIKAVRLRQHDMQVMHGDLTEVSLVMSGANPGAVIDNVYLEHSDGSIHESDTEAIIFTGESLQHEVELPEFEEDEEVEHENKTAQQVYDSLNDEQKDLLSLMIAQAQGDTDEEAEHGDSDEDADESDTLEHDQEGDTMTRNVFDQSQSTDHDSNTLTHEQVEQVFVDAARAGSLKESVLAHSAQYGITNIEALFPEPKNVRTTPEWIKRDQSWVRAIINGVHRAPFARIKSQSADITHEEARAKGYIKGDLKKDQYFSIAGRETTPKTIYKRQKFDRDDLIDVTDFDVVVWVKAEMRFMLEEEVARAILIGDGRDGADPDKINENNIRPIATDEDFYTHKVQIPPYLTAKGMIEAILRSRRHYKGIGNPVMYTTEDIITDLLLDEDKIGRRYHKTEEELAAALRVSKIVPVEVMEGFVNDELGELVAVLVNISDYTVGADKRGKTTMFDDFDIDYNQHKYLIELRMSGALTKHKTAVSVWRTDAEQVIPVMPELTGVNEVTIPTVTGVDYFVNNEEDPTSAGVVNIEDPGPLSVEAVPQDGYYFPVNIQRKWDYAFDSQD